MNCKTNENVRSRRGFASRHRRSGLAAVELAVCLPMLVLLVLGAIELSGFIFLKQGLTAAAYEAVRVAVKRDASEVQAQEQANAVLRARSIVADDFSITPNIGIDRGQELTVAISAPSSANRIVFPKFVKGINVTGAATMVKE